MPPAPILFVCLMFVVSHVVCIPQALGGVSCGVWYGPEGTLYDLSALPKHAGFYSYADSSSTYEFNICAHVPGGDAVGLVNSLSFGRPETQLFSDGVGGPRSGVVLTYTGGAPCGPHLAQSLSGIYHVNCDPDQTTLAVDSVVTDSVACTVTFVMRTNQACPQTYQYTAPDGTLYDFSDLNEINNVYSPDGSVTLYSLNIAGPVFASPCGVSTIGICQDPGDTASYGDTAISLGASGGVTYSGGGMAGGVPADVNMTFINGAPCYPEDPSVNWQTVVILRCFLDTLRILEILPTIGCTKYIVAGTTNVCYGASYSPTSSPSETASNSLTPTVTPSDSLTSSPSESSTATPSNSVTPAASDSSTSAPSETNTATASVSETRAPSDLPPLSRSRTRSESVSTTVTPAPSVPLGGLSRTRSRSKSAECSKTAERSFSPSRSTARSPEASKTPQASDSVSKSAEATKSGSHTPRASDSVSKTAAASSSVSKSATASKSVSTSATASKSVSKSADASKTASTSATASKSVSKSADASKSTSVSKTPAPSHHHRRHAAGAGTP